MKEKEDASRIFYYWKGDRSLHPDAPHLEGAIPGKSLTAVVVSYPPGGKTPSHRHAASVFIYAHVLSGSIRSQVDDDSKDIPLTALDPH